MSKAAFRRIIVGTLRDDITVSASRVQAACTYATVTMWADDLSVIRIDLPEHVEGVSPTQRHWHVRFRRFVARHRR